MSLLHDKLRSALPALVAERRAMIREHGEHVVSNVTVRQVFGGMRGVRALVCDTSEVDPDRGLIIRGIPVTHLADKTPEEVFFLLLTGELPTTAELVALRTELSNRSVVPERVWHVIDAMMPDAHPMAMMSAALLALDHTSIFQSRHSAGMRREEYWEPALDDVLTLLAMLPEIAARVYRLAYDKGAPIPRDPNLDWTGNLGHMMGIDDERFHEFLRLATVVQSDHEGAHASALTAHIVGSTLSNIYRAVASGWSALSGPLHGLASQVCLEWVLDALDTFGGVPTTEQIREYALRTIAGGAVIPGYGHAVLRGQDPRYLAILAFGKKHCGRDPVFKTVVEMSRVIPSILIEQGKVKNPWPNVDAINGSVFHHYGIKEVPFYTVFFAIALAFGFSAQYVINLALGSPITRPRSVTTSWIRDDVHR